MLEVSEVSKNKNGGTFLDQSESMGASEIKSMLSSPNIASP